MTYFHSGNVDFRYFVGFPDFQVPVPDELSDPNLTPLPTHPGIKYVARSLAATSAWTRFLKIEETKDKFKVWSPWPHSDPPKEFNT